MFFFSQNIFSKFSQAFEIKWKSHWIFVNGSRLQTYRSGQKVMAATQRFFKLQLSRTNTKHVVINIINTADNNQKCKLFKQGYYENYIYILCIRLDHIIVRSTMDGQVTSCTCHMNKIVFHLEFCFSLGPKLYACILRMF